MNSWGLTCIAELSNVTPSDSISLVARLDEIQEKTTKRGDPFWDLSLTDLTGQIRAFIWSNSPPFSRAESLLANTVIRVSGQIKRDQEPPVLFVKDLDILSTPKSGETHDGMDQGAKGVEFYGRRLVFDIETVPVGEMGELPEQVASKVREFAERGDGDTGKVLSLSPLLGRVIGVAFQDVDDAERAAAYVVGSQGELFPGEEGQVRMIHSEEELLNIFWGVVAKAPLVISFNGRNFDLPYLMVRSAVLGVVPSDRLSKNRFSIKPHLDLIEVITNFRALRGGPTNLGTCCHAFGIKSPKGGLDGSQVAKAYREGRLKEIGLYNLEDVRATTELFLHLERTLLAGRSDW